MNGNKYLPIVVMVAALALLGFLVWWLLGGGGGLSEKRGLEGEPIDVALGFYEPWLNERQASSSDPFALGLQNSTILSTEMSAKLASYEGKLGEGELDPVLCQTTVPEGLRTIPVFVQEDSAQYLVMSANKDPGQAIVTLNKDGNLWSITDITCGSGEMDPNQGEFNFDKDGQLLKNVPPPLDSKYWHLVFEEGGVMGHTAPLMLDSSSVCMKQDGSESVCSESMLSEAMSVHVQGQMTESGVQVKRIQFK